MRHFNCRRAISLNVFTTWIARSAIVLFHHRMDEVKDEFMDEVEVRVVEAMDEVMEEVEVKRLGPTTQ